MRQFVFIKINVLIINESILNGICFGKAFLNILTKKKKRDKRLNVISLKIGSWKVDFYKSAAYDL